jgi:AraC family transcriptional regulator
MGTFPGAILRGRNTDYHWSGEQPLSIKTFTQGRALYTIDGAYFAVDDASYLIVNAGQGYTIDIAAERPVTSFCLFFAPSLVSDVWHTMQSGDSCLLDEATQPLAEIHFYERAYRHDHLASPAIMRLRDAADMGNLDPVWLQEQMSVVLANLFVAHQRVRREVDGLSAARPATRDEIYRRVYRAREYAAAFYHTAVTLDDMARVACLSPNHLLRSFRQVFHQTPHQVLTACRLSEAARRLAVTDEPVTAICYAVGFASLGSFSSLFRRHYGVSPERYRRQMQNR